MNLLRVNQDTWQKTLLVFERGKLLVASVIIMTAGWLAMSSPEVNGEAIPSGVKAALFALGAAGAMGIDLLPTRIGFGASLSTLIARTGATAAAALAGYHWLLYETAGDPIPYLIPFIVVVAFLVCGVVGQFIGAQITQQRVLEIRKQKEEEIDERSERYNESMAESIQALRDEDLQVQELTGRAIATDYILARLIWGIRHQRSKVLELDSLYTQGDDGHHSHVSIAFRRTVRQIGILSGELGNSE